MRIALNKNGERVSIENAKLGEKYYCQSCGEELIQKKGNIKEYHFAHKANSECDDWNYDMSEWHESWQQLFPASTREVVVKCNEEKHRADVLIKNTVIEFQHSSMSNDEFWERNYFYTKAGYKVVWIFDQTSKNECGHILAHSNKPGIYKYKYHSHTFDEFMPNKHKDVTLYFQLTDDYDGVEIGEVCWFSENYGYFMIEDDYTFNEKEFVRMFVSENKDDEECDHSIIDIVDEIPEKNVNGNWVVECPEIQKQVCFENCGCCKYSADCISVDSIGKKFNEELGYFNRDYSEDYSMGCLYRFKDIFEGWDLKNDTVDNIERDDFGKITRIKFIKNKALHDIDYSISKKNLLDLLKETDAKVVIAKNTKTGRKFKIGNNFDKTNVNKIYGFIDKKDEKEFYEERREIFGWDKSEWIIVWELKV